MTKDEWMPMVRWFGGVRRGAGEDHLYARIVALARDPLLFTAGGVPDTLDGRFDALALTLSLVLQRIDGATEQETKAARRAVDRWQGALVERFVDDMDRSLREMGVGDVSVGRKVRQMATAQSGRHLAYMQALAADDPHALEQALVRNIWRGEQPASDALATLAAWVTELRGRLRETGLDDLHEGRIA